MRIGITGHQRLDDPTQWPQVREELIRYLEGVATPLIGITSLAIGADQLFADIVLELGGTIEVVIPFEGYELKFSDGASRQHYRTLLSRAAQVITLPSSQSEEAAYFEAGKLVTKLSDAMVAVWDGNEAEGLGGTADVVTYAKQIMKPIIIIPVSG